MPAGPSISVLDCNNFWSPSGGGVRRYHLQKLEHFRRLDDVKYTFLMPDDHRETEVLGATTVVEHVPATKFPGNWEYRFVLDVEALREVILRHRPDVIEVGSPYVMPWMVRRALRGLPFRPKVIGFWHADFPVTYLGRFFSRFGSPAGKAAEALGWWYARLQFNPMEGILVPSRVILDRMREHGLRNLHCVPLGVDTETFHQGRRDGERARELKAGLPERLTLFFGHRFQEEKGILTLLKAYPRIRELLGHEPAIVFAGTGPELGRVKQAAAEWKHVRYVGFVRDPLEMAAWYASCEMGLAMSGWETFGLSILEAMACGQVLVGADQGAACEHIRQSGAGLAIPVADAEALAQGIVSLHRNPRREEMARAGMAYAQSLTWDRCFANELDVYRATLRGAGQPWPSRTA
jgi:alpha-1,6-mannosyltransferase